MREVLPNKEGAVDLILEIDPDEKIRVAKIRTEKKEGRRPFPSANLIDRSEILDSKIRKALLDQVAMLVDENLFGRSERSIQFAMLLDKALKHLGYDSRVATGIASYFIDGRELFSWEHTWIRVGKEIVDGNVDILFENPMVPDTVKIAPYWGLVTKSSKDRKLKESVGSKHEKDTDVENVWWPDLMEQVEDL